MQFLNKKKTLYGAEKVGVLPQNNNGAGGLENMKLDRDDSNNTGIDMYDPFYKVNKLDIELQAQMNIMNKQNTLGNKMWTPEY